MRTLTICRLLILVLFAALQKKLNQRLADSLNEVLLLSSHVVSELCLDITANIAALYKVGRLMASTMNQEAERMPS